MAKRKKKHLIACPYCRNEIRHCDSQRDHVPPDGLFAKPRPSDLITVRCCPKCHSEWSVGDEVLKAMAAMGVARSGGASKIQEELNRALERNPWWKKELAKGASSAMPVSINYRETTALGYKIPLSQKFTEAMDTTVKRITIGLLFHKNPDFDSTRHRFEVIPGDEEQPEHFLNVLDELGKLPDGITLGGDVFFACWGFAHDAPGRGIMVMTICGGLSFAVFIYPE